MATPGRALDAAADGYDSSFAHLCEELARIELLVRGQVERARQAAGDDPYRGLVITEAEVDALLARGPGTPCWDVAGAGPSLRDAHALAARLATRIEGRRARSTAPLRLALLQERFALDRFDLDVVMVALAPELDARFERLYAYLQDDVTRKRPTMDLALHLLCESFEQRVAARARFSAGAPLVRHRILRPLAEGGATSGLASPLQLDERIVDWLHGSDEPGLRLAPHAVRIVPRQALGELVLDAATVDSLRRLAGLASPAPVLYLHGPRGSGRRTAAEALAAACGRALLAFDAARLHGLSDEHAEAAVREAAREARLAGDVLLVEHAQQLLEGERAAARAALLEAARGLPTPVVLAADGAWEPGDALRERGFVRFALEAPDARQRADLWCRALAGPEGAAQETGVDIDALARRWRLTGGQIHDAVSGARGLARARAGEGAAPGMSELTEACRRQSGRRFGPGARPCGTHSTWDDLVLPDDRVERLRELCDHARHRSRVLDDWGFERRLPSGKALSGLFVGAPGTGKTFAASIIAAELGLEMFQIDLATVVSKWVGETEKNLSRIFDEAEQGHGVLFFDEADALFGKRTEVRDAHDRYANLETSYLLQRIEAYEGVVILASNFRRNLDEAFVRRLRFIVDFPLPEEGERLRIWERIWPEATPRAADLDLPWLAHHFELAGAYIRNIALAAAFLAAARGEPVGQGHVLHATRREYQKMGKMVNESLFRTAPRAAAAASRP